METVFSDPQGAKVDFLKECRSNGYSVVMVFIGLESADLSRGRIMERVEAGGHDVPDEKIVTRFPRTFANLRQALTFVDQAFLFDNSSADQPYRLSLSSGTEGGGDERATGQRGRGSSRRDRALQSGARKTSKGRANRQVGRRGSVADANGRGRPCLSPG